MRRRRFNGRGVIVALALFVTSAAMGSTIAVGEIAKQESVIVAFHGDISPRRLPRTTTAPVAVQIGGKIKTTNPLEPPVLDRIVIDINRHGRLQSRGLALCPIGKLRSLSSAGAKRTCGDALVGRGNVTSRVSLPGQEAFALNGPLLAFNGRHRGHPAILAQVATGAPLPLTYVIPFEIQARASGVYGTRLIGTLPPIASSYGYISAFDLSLKRRYEHAGQKLSFASADCPAPKGFPGASFSLARASYEFSNGTKVRSTLVRECRVRGK